MARYRVPNEFDVKNILTVLFDGSEVKEGAADLDVDQAGGFFGLYVDDDNQPVTACVCDIDFAAYSACSLTMLPPPLAKESVNAGKLEDNMVANLGEVFNILSRLFMTNDTDHLRFLHAHQASEIPADLVEKFSNASKKVSFGVSIPRYGQGTFSMLVA